MKKWKSILVGLALATTLVLGVAQFNKTDSADPGGVGNKPASVDGEVVAYDPGGVGNKPASIGQVETLRDPGGVGN